MTQTRPRLDATLLALQSELLNYTMSQAAAAASKKPLDDKSPACSASLPNEAMEDVFSKLEYMGYQSGLRIVERLARDRPRMREELDVMRFLCREGWELFFNKQVDSLKTDVKTYKTFEVIDKNFLPLQSILNSGNRQYLTLAPRLLAYPSGLIRGLLANLGVNSVINPRICPLNEIEPGASVDCWVTVFEVRMLSG